jgi:tight adherence protein C
MTVLTVFALLGLVAGDVLGIPLWLMTALGAFFLPDLWLKEKVVKRQRAVLKALPSVIDLLNACVEAGLVFEGAMARVAELEKRSVLGEEFRAALQDIRLGKTRREALLAMADRVDLPELTTVVHAVIQAERMGTSMGPMLRVQADDLRVKRRQRAEKLALEAPVKLLMPLLLCIFPVVFLVIFTPIILQLMESLK